MGIKPTKNEEIMSYEQLIVPLNTPWAIGPWGHTSRGHFLRVSPWDHHGTQRVGVVGGRETWMQQVCCTCIPSSQVFIYIYTHTVYMYHSNIYIYILYIYIYIYYTYIYIYIHIYILYIYIYIYYTYIYIYMIIYDILVDAQTHHKHITSLASNWPRVGPTYNILWC